MTTAKSSLHEKLAALRANFGPVLKTGENKGVGQGYSFVEATEVARKFVEDASGYGLTMLCIDAQLVGEPLKTPSERQFIFTLRTVWRITDSGSGDYIDVVAFGQGADNSDKALPKAQTNAMKYAILAAVLQKAGDDAGADPNTDALEREADARAPQRPTVVAGKREDPGAAAPTQALIRKLMATFDEKGLKDPDKRKAFTSATVGKSSSKELVVADVEKLLIALADFKGLAEEFDGPEPASVAGGD
jgi:hypothetical protein